MYRYVPIRAITVPILVLSVNLLPKNTTEVPMMTTLFTTLLTPCDTGVTRDNVLKANCTQNHHKCQELHLYMPEMQGLLDFARQARQWQHEASCESQQQPCPLHDKVLGQWSCSMQPPLTQSAASSRKSKGIFSTGTRMGTNLCHKVSHKQTHQQGVRAKQLKRWR